MITPFPFIEGLAAERARGVAARAEAQRASRRTRVARRAERRRALLAGLASVFMGAGLRMAARAERAAPRPAGSG